MELELSLMTNSLITMRVSSGRARVVDGLNTPVSSQQEYTIGLNDQELRITAMELELSLMTKSLITMRVSSGRARVVGGLNTPVSAQQGYTIGPNDQELRIKAMELELSLMTNSLITMRVSSGRARVVGGLNTPDVSYSTAMELELSLMTNSLITMRVLSGRARVVGGLNTPVSARQAALSLLLLKGSFPTTTNGRTSGLLARTGSLSVLQSMQQLYPLDCAI
ncbi:hypothetical protein J6590_043450 [Homalodisca vitripennis]|nr:hypothetical protein J6590_043450 [Homalodisca vitripennis]